MNIYSVVGRITVDIRKDKNMTQEELALNAGISMKQLKGIENGERAINLTMADRLARALGITLHELFDKIDEYGRKEE